MKIAHVSDNHSNLDMVLRIGQSDAEMLIWTGDALPNVGFVGYGHQIDPSLECEYQRKILNEFGRELEVALQGRPLLFVRGNHDFTLFGPILKGFGVNIHEICDSNPYVDIMGKRFAGFRHIPYIDGHWSGEVQSDILDSLSESLMMSNPDVILTHAPPYGILDNDGDKHWGITSLTILLTYLEHKVTHHFFGHVHSRGGEVEENMGIQFVNGAKHFREHQI